MYFALKRRGIPAKMIQYKDQPHGIGGHWNNVHRMINELEVVDRLPAKGTDLYVATHEIDVSDVIKIIKITSVGQASVFATINATGFAPIVGYAFPTDLALDPAGILYVTAGNNYPGTYWQVGPTGVVSVIPSYTARGPSSIEFDEFGDVFVTDAFADVMLKNGGTFAAYSNGLAFANGLLFGGGQLYALGSSILAVSSTAAFQPCRRTSREIHQLSSGIHRRTIS